MRYVEFETEDEAVNEIQTAATALFRAVVDHHRFMNCPTISKSLEISKVLGTMTIESLADSETEMRMPKAEIVSRAIWWINDIAAEESDEQFWSLWVDTFNRRIGPPPEDEAEEFDE